MLTEKNFRISVLYNVFMQSFEVKHYYLLFIDTCVYRTMTNRKIYKKCMIMTACMWRQNKTRKISQRGFSFIMFLLFKNMIKSLQILSIRNTIFSG